MSGEGERKMEKRRRVTIEKIEDVNKLQVSFSKRKKGLFKKASELCIFSGADLAIIVFSPAGNPFVFGHPSVDTAIDNYLGQPAEQQPQLPDGGDEEIELSRFWWDRVDPKRVKNTEELQRMVQEMEEARTKVLKRADELASASHPGLLSMSGCHGVDEAYNALPPLLNIDWDIPSPSEYDAFPDAVAEPGFLPAGGGDAGSYNALSPFMNLDGYIASPSDYATAPAAVAEPGLLPMPADDKHDGDYNALSPFMNLDGYIASPSDYDTAPAAVAEPGLLPMPADDKHNGDYNALSPFKNLDGYIASPSDYDTAPAAVAEPGLRPMPADDKHDRDYNALSPLIDLPEYKPAMAADENLSTMNDGILDGMSPLDFEGYIAEPWAYERCSSLLSESCF